MQPRCTQLANAFQRASHGTRCSIRRGFTQRKPFSMRELSSSANSVMVHSALDMGCIEYARSWAWQHVLLNRRLAQRRSSDPDLQQPQRHDQDCVLLLEHAPVYTLGRGADENHLNFIDDETHYREEIQAKLSRKVRGPGTARLALDRSHQQDFGVADSSMEQAVQQISNLASPVVAPNGVPIYRVERGGEVTFHGPSQLVVYPLFDLRREPFEQDLHWYLRMVEEVVIQTLRHYDIQSERDEENTGVWVGENKVAAVGISSSRWITSHGFALNVDPDLSYFDTSVILPCGIEGKGVTSMANVLAERGKNTPTMMEVADVVIKTMEDVFNVSLEHGQHPS